MNLLSIFRRDTHRNWMESIRFDAEMRKAKAERDAAMADFNATRKRLRGSHLATRHLEAKCRQYTHSALARGE